MLSKLMFWKKSNSKEYKIRVLRDEMEYARYRVYGVFAKVDDLERENEYLREQLTSVRRQHEQDIMALTRRVEQLEQAVGDCSSMMPVSLADHVAEIVDQARTNTDGIADAFHQIEKLRNEILG